MSPNVGILYIPGSQVYKFPSGEQHGSFTMKSPRPWTNALIHKNIHYACLFFSAQEQTNSDDFRVLSPPFLAKSLLFISKPFTFLLSTAWHLCTTPAFTVWCNCILLVDEAVYPYRQMHVLLSAGHEFVDKAR